jgi:hypothetical protein
MVAPSLRGWRAEHLPPRNHRAQISKWLQYTVQRSSHDGSGPFGISGPNRSFKSRLSASYAAIQAMSGPLRLEFLSYGSTRTLVTGSIFKTEVRC